MGRHQCKNSLNNLKNNRKPPEPSDSTTGGHEHLNQEEVEKMESMKVIDILKQHVKNALMEMDEKYNRKFEELNKPRKPRKNNQTDNGNSSRTEN